MWEIGKKWNDRTVKRVVSLALFLSEELLLSCAPLPSPGLRVGTVISAPPNSNYVTLDEHVDGSIRILLQERTDGFSYRITQLGSNWGISDGRFVWIDFRFDFVPTRITYASRLGSDVVFIVEGYTSQCPVTYFVFATDTKTNSRSPIGKCGIKYRFADDGQTLQAIELGVENPEIFTFANRQVHGPSSPANEPGHSAADQEHHAPVQSLENDPRLPPPEPE